MGPDEQLPLFARGADAPAPQRGFPSVTEALPRAERSWAEALARPLPRTPRSAAGVASKLSARSAKPKAPTFATQKAAILAGLRHAGWDVKDGLKVPHATSPTGIRFWFKTQAIYYSLLEGGRFDFGNAHSLTSDMRERSASDMIAYLVRIAERIARR